MHAAPVTPGGAKIRWVEIAGETRPARVYVHGLGSSSAPYFTGAATHPRLSGHRSLMVDLLGFGISDRPTDFDYTLEGHADTLAAALRAADVAEADVVAHSMGGAVAIVLARRHPELVGRLVLVDANIDPVRSRGTTSRGIAGYTEREFLDRGWHDMAERVGEHWWSTMRLGGREALYRTAVHLANATIPTMREMLVDLTIPRTYLHPEDSVPENPDMLARADVALVPVADAGHNIMLDNPEGFATAVAAAVV